MPSTSPRKRGYDTQWDRLSKQARQRQDWCSRCGRRKHLTVHHTPAAWAKRAAGHALTLRDFTGAHPLLIVLCQRCNNELGAAR